MRLNNFGDQSEKNVLRSHPIELNLLPDYLTDKYMERIGEISVVLNHLYVCLIVGAIIILYLKYHKYQNTKIQVKKKRRKKLRLCVLMMMMMTTANYSLITY